MMLALANTGLLNRGRCAITMPEGYADQHREQRGKANQSEMLQREFQHLIVILQDESKDVHDVPRLAADSNPSPKALT